MKLFRVFLSVFAFAIAIVGATASADFDQPTTDGVTIGGVITYSTVEQTCDDALTSGIQCTVITPSGNKAAYKIAANTSPLYRP